jgi:hypothetical protein
MGRVGKPYIPGRGARLVRGWRQRSRICRREITEVVSKVRKNRCEVRREGVAVSGVRKWTAHAYVARQTNRCIGDTSRIDMYQRSRSGG